MLHTKTKCLMIFIFCLDLSHLGCSTLMIVFLRALQNHQFILYISKPYRPRRVGSVVRVSASHTVGRGFASRPGHTKDHHKNGTNCLPA